MKRWVSILAVIFLSLIFGTIPVYAQNQVHTLEIDIALREDGSAYVTQDFYVTTDEGTEFYLERLDSGYLEFSDFIVSDEKEYYDVVEEWDVDASFDEKAGKCGMRSISGGKELCWGITEYGEHYYRVEYVIHNFVSAYSDVDGFHYRMIDPYQDLFPTDATIVIRMEDGTPLVDESCDIWAFGYDGMIVFEDGVIIAYTENSLEDSNFMSCMVGFEKGLFSPKHMVDDSFETVKEEAFEGSDYDSEVSGGEVLAALIGMAMSIGAVVLVVTFLDKRKKRKLQKMVKDAEYFRDAPNDGNLNMTFVLGSGLEFFPDNHYLGVRILRLISMGCLEPIVVNDKKESVSLQFIKEPHNGDAFDEVFYTFLQAAAGADGMLQDKELEKFCKDNAHAKSLNSIMKKCEADGTTAIIHKGCFKGADTKNLKKLTPEGNKQLQEILGLKRYLQEFSLINERSINETIIWQDYMVYAMMFGIADEVMEQMKGLYPDSIPQIQTYQQYMGGVYRYDHILYTAVQLERQRERERQMARSAGSGGRASYGGGGGFSGGGRTGTR